MEKIICTLICYFFYVDKILQLLFSRPMYILFENLTTFCNAFASTCFILYHYQTLLKTTVCLIQFFFVSSVARGPAVSVRAGV